MMVCCVRCLTDGMPPFCRSRGTYQRTQRLVQISGQHEVLVQCMLKSELVISFLQGHASRVGQNHKYMVYVRRPQ